MSLWSKDLWNVSDCHSEMPALSSLSISLHILGHDGPLNTAISRAKLYIKLSQACAAANDYLQLNRIIWSNGGDGVVFGVHCVDHSLNNVDDERDIWQDHLDDMIDDPKVKDHEPIPHLRAIYNYGNDTNEVWHVIFHMLEISKLLSSKCIHAAIECLDQNDQLILVEAAEVLPTWVDDDVTQGGVGGPRGCINRCWIVNGQVRLIPPTNNQHNNKLETNLIRSDALHFLRECIHSDVYVYNEIQAAIETRIDRTSYSIQKRTKQTSSNSGCTDDKMNENDPVIPHYHVTAAALPASVANFIQNHSNLIPLLVDSFCNGASKYLDATSNDLECKSPWPQNDNHNPREDGVKLSSTKRSELNRNLHLGANFAYERMVLCPIIMTRTTYAELLTGRGMIPSFPTPLSYRSVELKRFQRQLNQMRGERDVWKSSVEIGVRLCAGLEWILNVDDIIKKETDEAALSDSLSGVERRIRLHWSRIDAEAGLENLSDVKSTDKVVNVSWIEQTWQSGPNNTSDKILSDAINSMSKCPVFHPELSKLSYDEPCPYSQPGVSLHKMTHLGIKRSIQWTRDSYTDSSFPLPREWELGDDSWMNVNSLEDLEDEMRKLSNTKITRPRRTTRRSRRNFANQNELKSPEKNGEGSSISSRNESHDIRLLEKMARGFQSLVEGENDFAGVVTHRTNETSPPELALPQEAMSYEVNINPTDFLKVMQEKLRSMSSVNNEESPRKDQDMSKFFFINDMEDCDSDGSSIKFDEHSEVKQNSQSLKEIMVSPQMIHVLLIR